MSICGSPVTYGGVSEDTLRGRQGLNALHGLFLLNNNNLNCHWDNSRPLEIPTKAQRPWEMPVSEEQAWPQIRERRAAEAMHRWLGD